MMQSRALFRSRKIHLDLLEEVKRRRVREARVAEKTFIRQVCVSY